jgi:hypothetical protein
MGAAAGNRSGVSLIAASVFWSQRALGLRLPGFGRHIIRMVEDAEIQSADSMSIFITSQFHRGSGIWLFSIHFP